MLSKHPQQQCTSLEDVGSDLLSFVLQPGNWVEEANLPRDVALAATREAAYQRTFGSIRVRASVDIQPNLHTHLRVAFRAPGLSPLKAADHLEMFLKSRLPLLPNTEWQVEVDGRSWIHFVRPYTLEKLRA